MTPEFSLAHLTVLSLSPPDMIAVAARTGYRHVGLRLIAVTAETPGYPLMNDKAMMCETKSRLGDTGVGVLDIEFVRLAPETDIASFESFLEAGAELGARHVITAAYDPDRARLIGRYAALCDLAAPFGLSVDLEFYPWTAVPNLSSAVAVVGAADRPNSGILLDTLHFDRSDSTLGELDHVPSNWLPFVHVCDAPAERPKTTEGLIFTARAERLFPGDGGIDIAGIMRHMPPGVPVAVETPMERLTREVGPEEVARRAREAAARTLATVQSIR
jgi:sugar phosphate isomerase/epimerase